MSNKALQVDEIEIGAIGNSISTHNDGSMILKDRYVPGVRLIDLLGGEVVIDPATIIEVAHTDWIIAYHDNVFNRDFYKIDIYFGYFNNQSGASLANPPDSSWQTLSGKDISVSADMVVHNKLSPIQFHSVEISNISATILSTEPVNCFIKIKRV